MTWLQLLLLLTPVWGAIVVLGGLGIHDRLNRRGSQHAAPGE